MNAYGHRAPQYPYSRDGATSYAVNSYAPNPPPHPASSMGSTPQFSHSKFGYRHPRHDSLKYNSVYPKEAPPAHLDYNHVGWTNAGSDAPPDYYSMNAPPNASHAPYSDLKDSYAGSRAYSKPEAPPHSGWDDPVVNQYSNVRLAMFLENCNYSCELMESDLRELFSYYSGINSISMSPDYPAAELILNDPSACSAAVSELNGFVLNGIGTLRCVLMRSGQTLDSLLSNANVFQPYKAPSSASDAPSTRYSYSPDSGPAKNGIFHAPNQGAAKPPRPITLNGVEHVPGVSNRPDVKRMARFELTELFSYEPDFDVTNTILGPNNANIEYIMKNSDNKVDISLKGKPLNAAPVSDRLHLSITSNDFYPYNRAIFMVEDLLSSVCEKYVDYVKACGHSVSHLMGFRRHEYEQDAEGLLDYKGYVDKEKTWLDQLPRRMPYKPNYRNNFKKVSDRSRPIPNARPVAARVVPSARNRPMRK
ncbi:conserved hypothetical protein [Theileria orientalis strain Shintoku]|uniref:KHDC4/BBP-like KH-domain type I domain-containing protein n=1 Tax=Theileria orientalis strain Shintoku TaxID=869250 RepID=J4C818_THEOR|nr:conserved hypothetical protein [Theileria orientalis strain Shintoku]BAM40013.1 conserved hypothetical protein [Theileria orientalis strain Shintoku]|eukprot:XP_009690314.1 conserved hypothetical protein [Theileria orientalis strain Shintoku]